MKKLFLVSLTSFLLFVAYIEEGGSIRQLISPTVIVLLVFGTLFTTMFSFSFREIMDTFKDCFSKDELSERLNNYQKGLLIVQNLATATMFWSWTIVVMATILVLSHLSSPNELGPSLAVGFLSLLFGFGTRAALFIPMEYSLHKKILSIKGNQD